MDRNFSTSRYWTSLLLISIEIFVIRESQIVSCDWLSRNNPQFSTFSIKYSFASDCKWIDISVLEDIGPAYHQFLSKCL